MQKNFKEILDELDALPCLRPAKELTDRDVDAVVVCHATELVEAVAFYKSRLRRPPPLYVVGDSAAPLPADVSTQPAALLPMSVVPHVFCKPAKQPRLTKFNAVLAWLHKAGFERCIVESASGAQFWGRKPCVFSQEDVAKIGVIYNRLSDQASKTTYLAAIKARMTGEAGYLPRSPYAQYFHPDVHPSAGDCLCEGGIDNGKSTERLAAAVTDTGRIHGFEPVPESYTRCKEGLARWPQITLINKALWSHSGTMPFAAQVGSLNAASICKDGDSTCLCETIDGYFQNKRLDCIKLDVEGAELQVLIGAAQNLLLHKPKLCVSIYHNGSRDLVDVPWHILQTEGAYQRLYVGHHGFWFNETILYARSADERT